MKPNVIFTAAVLLALQAQLAWANWLTVQRHLPKTGVPGKGARAIATGDNRTVRAIQSQFDHDVLHSSHKALGTRSGRGRGEGHAPACAMTRGSWCKEYYRQERVAWKPAPRGSTDCPATKWGPCNGVGNCHYDIGVCQCPAGWRGAACDEPNKRPCTNSHKLEGDPLDLVLGHVAPDGSDLDLTASGWTASRCAGHCDADRATCWCPADAAFGRKPPPPDSPPWVRYSQRGRPIAESCKPGKVPNKAGEMVETDWGNKQMSFAEVVGPQGWCGATTPEEIPQAVKHQCGGYRGCWVEGLHGPLCDLVSEETCLNQCSGHGECDEGYCRCHTGWYGQDCARKKAGEAMEPGLQEDRPWLKDVALPVPAAATEPPAAAAAGPGGGAEAGGRLRPLIYVYDMPPEFTSRMHQYKFTNDHCGYRQWMVRNRTELYADGYSVEVYLHEMLAVSPHRTYDPEEADFFYVPVYYTCFMWPINGWADMPFWGPPSAHFRYANAAHMWLQAKNWIQSAFPFWDRRGGRDHIWMTNHDEGACYMPTEIYTKSIMLTHWGRMDLNHTSNTAYLPDNYTNAIEWPGVPDSSALFAGHPCYDPAKDLVIPGFKVPNHFRRSPLLGGAAFERDILLYLRGDVGKHRMPNYSRGIRQKLSTLSRENLWNEKHRIFIGEQVDVPGDYSEHLSRSTFCVVAPGDGYAMRFEDAVLHGCLPLIIMDNTHAVFETIVDIDAFSLRVTEAAVDEHLPYILKAISADQIERMQRRLALVWHRFVYAHGPLVASAMRSVTMRNLGTDPDDPKQVQDVFRQLHDQVPPTHPYQPVHSFPHNTDAVSTILQWLHGRIKHTRGAGGAGAASAG